MTGREFKKRYFDFFSTKGHKILPNASLMPENDPTALFISAGMHPLVPYLLGELHPLGKRLVSVQRCLRTGDIEEVGDTTHHTFFEMLGNWSLGEYFKKEAIEWSYEFLTSKEWLGIDKNRLAVSVFAGDQDSPFDKESYDIWLSLGIPSTRIAKLPKKNNWWGPVGETGPCGPDTEMFVWTGSKDAPSSLDPNDSSWVEIWNDVFMQYTQKADGSYEPLSQRNVDTGMGVERTLAILNGLDDNYRTDLFWPIIQKIEEISGNKYEGEYIKPMRIIADHLRASVFLVSDGVEPSNQKQGYVLRRLLRRAVVVFSSLTNTEIRVFLDSYKLSFIAGVIIETYKSDYLDLKKNEQKINSILEGEWNKFKSSMYSAYPALMKVMEKAEKIVSGDDAFYLFETHGVLPSVIEEVARRFDKDIDWEAFKSLQTKHQELSKSTSADMFKGGLADNSETVTGYHTATHLLQAALRQILGEHIQQKGSNLTSERLRFDFSHPEKLKEDQIKIVEDLVNQKINENLPVTMETMRLAEAQKKGALAFFTQKYDEMVKVYSIGDFSKEVCGGPHVDFTGKLGKFKIIKEEAAGSGIRRIYATLD